MEEVIRSLADNPIESLQLVFPVVVKTTHDPTLPDLKYADEVVLAAVFRALHRLTSGMPVAYLPRLSQEHKSALVKSYGDLPGAASNDAIVPTLRRAHRIARRS